MLRRPVRLLPLRPLHRLPRNNSARNGLSLGDELVPCNSEDTEHLLSSEGVVVQLLEVGVVDGVAELVVAGVFVHAGSGEEATDGLADVLEEVDVVGALESGEKELLVWVEGVWKREGENVRR